MRARARRSIILTGGAVAAATGVVSTPAHAVVDAVEVTNLNDSGPGSLRDAIVAANTDPDLTTITFATGVTGTITLATGPLLVGSAVTIVGPGADALRVDGGGLSGVFVFYGQAYDGESLISDITISGGGVTGQSLFGTGSGIVGIDSHLTLDSVVVEQNEATAGGGVLLIGADVQFLATDSTIRNNTISNEMYIPIFGGAGIAFLSIGTPGLDQVARGALDELPLIPAPADSRVTLVDSTVSGNSGAVLGGGVLTFGFGGTLTIDHSTVSGNSAVAGGGIAAYGYVTTDIVDSTISGNSAIGSEEAQSGITGIGGGVLTFDLYAPVTTSAPTVVQARSPLAPLAEAVSTARAGRVQSRALYYGSFSIENTTISGNTADSLGGGMMVIEYVSCVCEPGFNAVDVDPSPSSVTNTIIGGNLAPGDPDVSIISGFIQPESNPTASAGEESGGRAADQGFMYSFGTFEADYSVIGAIDPDGTQASGTGLLLGDPLLGPLADNGGPTLTQLPQTGSPAIDTGDPAFVAPPADDQRHGSRVVNDALDIGAVEVVPGPVDDSYSTPEDTALVVPVNGVLGNDPDAVNLTAAITTWPSHGMVTFNADGSFTYTPNANYNGPDSFTYTTTGLFGVTGTATVTIAVTPVNDPPVAVDDTSSATQGGPAVGINVLANDSDPDGDTLSITGTSAGAGGTSFAAGRSPAHGLVSFTPTSVVYTPTATFAGVDTFTYTITDGALSTTATVTVTVNAAETAAAPPSTAPPTMPPPIELPATGQPTDNSVELAMGTLGTGVALTLIGRRRRRRIPRRA